MSRRHALRAAMLAGILLVVTLGTTSMSATAQESDAGAVRFSGEGTCVAAALAPDPDSIDSDDPTNVSHFVFESTSLLSGDFVGVDHTSGSFTLDLETGAVNGYIDDDTFHGVYEPDGSAGIMRREGPFQGNVNTELRFNQRIKGGTDDFEGARGHFTFVLVGLLPPVSSCPAGGGPYDGVWSRP